MQKKDVYKRQELYKKGKYVVDLKTKAAVYAFSSFNKNELEDIVNVPGITIHELPIDTYQDQGIEAVSYTHLQQLKAILNTDVKVIKLLDRSFNAKTEHALEILDFVFKNCHPGVQLQFEINGDVLDQRIIDFINEEAPDGLLRFEIGIQSTYEPTNKVVQRYQNFERLCDVIRQLQQNHKIDFHLDLDVYKRQA